MVAKLTRASLVASLLVFSVVIPAHPEGDDPDTKPDPEPYTALASRAAPGTPNIDGHLDDAAWALAQIITDFTQRDPDEGLPATERTEARVLYDDGAIYIGIRAYDSEPDKIVGQLTRRDQHSPSDWLVVSIDSHHDRRTAFEFRVNPSGVERDAFRYDDRNMDNSWNAVWDVSTSVDEEGWTAEFRIPLSQLRFSPAPEQVWGFNITRIIQRKNETDLWKPIAKDAPGWVSEYGDLAGLQGIEPKRRLELLPYMVTQQALTPAVDGNPFETGSAFYGNVGADIRFGLTSSLTLAATINPDFGQVEADPSVVNLSAFESFFSERRPFFMEGADIFRVGVSAFSGAEQLFYSRRIGRRPQGSADPRGGFVEYPLNTTIIGAGKVSGKSANGWSIGVLGAVTGEEKATVIDSEGNRHRDVVEPLTNYSAARVQKEFDGGQRALGVMFTGVNRNLPATMGYLRSSAYSGGIDGRTRFADGNWEVRGQLLGSHVRGTPEAIANTQLSSARYFLRPDADHLTFDDSRTSLTGTSGQLSLSKIGGEHWRGEVNGEWVSPGFEINDLGFLRSSDVIRNSLWVQYREDQPGKVFRRWNINYNLWNMMTFGNERTATGTNINGSFSLLSYWGGFGGVNYELPALNIRVLRGGPAMKGPESWNAFGGFFTDNRKPVVLEVGGHLWQDVVRSYSRGVWLDVTYRPVTNIRLSLGPQFNAFHDDWQYVTTQDVEGTDRFVLGVLDQKTVSLTTRLEVTFTPDMSLQLYAQPFVSAGKYTAFSEVTDPVASEYDDRFDPFESDRLSYEESPDPGGEPGTYHVDLNRDGATDMSFSDPNFSFKELRSTLVFRWEYLRGSTFFFVWSQNRSAFDFTGDFNPRNDFNRLLDSSGNNIFSIKINYYITP
jgi:hypothetical protein